MAFLCVSVRRTGRSSMDRCEVVGFRNLADEGVPCTWTATQVPFDELRSSVGHTPSDSRLFPYNFVRAVHHHSRFCTLPERDAMCGDRALLILRAAPLNDHLLWIVKLLSRAHVEIVTAISSNAIREKHHRFTIPRDGRGGVIRGRIYNRARSGVDSQQTTFFKIVLVDVKWNGPEVLR